MIVPGFHHPKFLALVPKLHYPKLPVIVTRLHHPKFLAIVPKLHDPKLPAIVPRFHHPEFPVIVPKLHHPKLSVIVPRFHHPKFPAIVLKLQHPKLPVPVPGFQQPKLPVPVPAGAPSLISPSPSSPPSLGPFGAVWVKPGCSCSTRGSPVGTARPGCPSPSLGQAQRGTDPEQEKSNLKPLREDVGLHRGLHRPAPRWRIPWLVPEQEGDPRVVREAEETFLVPVPQSVPCGLDHAVHGHGLRLLPGVE